MAKWVIGFASAILVSAAAEVWLPPPEEDRQRVPRQCSGRGELRAQHGVTDTAWDRVGSIDLILCYDEEFQVFIGTLTNTGHLAVPGARLEVQLSNGVRLGPTARALLAPGQVLALELHAHGQRFRAWSVRIAVGATARPLSRTVSRRRLSYSLEQLARRVRPGDRITVTLRVKAESCRGGLRGCRPRHCPCAPSSRRWNWTNGKCASFVDATGIRAGRRGDRNARDRRIRGVVRRGNDEGMPFGRSSLAHRACGQSTQ